MRRNRSKHTKPELALRRALWALGLRYRLHPPNLPGKPDIVFRRKRVAVFVDGDFWHGRDWVRRRAKLARGSNADYWVRKIEYNRERARKHQLNLERMGWAVVRVWESDIKADASAEAESIRVLLQRR